MKRAFTEPPLVSYKGLWAILTTVLLAYSGLAAYIYDVHREQPHAGSASKADLREAVRELREGQQNIYNLLYSSRPPLLYPNRRGSTDPSG